jgi:hypothetical protein
MEFQASSDGPIIPNLEKATGEHIERTQRAMDFFRANADRIEYFKQRAEELRRSGHDPIITLINVDDPVGSILADILMPGHDWQSYRDNGEIPVARGLASKTGIPDFLEECGYTIAAGELAANDSITVLVLDAEVALVLDVEFDER